MSSENFLTNTIKQFAAPSASDILKVRESQKQKLQDRIENQFVIRNFVFSNDIEENERKITEFAVTLADMISNSSTLFDLLSDEDIEVIVAQLATTQNTITSKEFANAADWLYNQVHGFAGDMETQSPIQYAGLVKQAAMKIGVPEFRLEDSTKRFNPLIALRDLAAVQPNKLQPRNIPGSVPKSGEILPEEVEDKKRNVETVTRWVNIFESAISTGLSLGSGIANAATAATINAAILLGFINLLEGPGLGKGAKKKDKFRSWKAMGVNLFGTAVTVAAIPLVTGISDKNMAKEGFKSHTQSVLKGEGGFKTPMQALDTASTTFASDPVYKNYLSVLAEANREREEQVDRSKNPRGQGDGVSAEGRLVNGSEPIATRTPIRQKFEQAKALATTKIAELSQARSNGDKKSELSLQTEVDAIIRDIKDLGTRGAGLDPTVTALIALDSQFSAQTSSPLVRLKGEMAGKEFDVDMVFNNFELLVAMRNGNVQEARELQEFYTKVKTGVDFSVFEGGKYGLIAAREMPGNLIKGNINNPILFVLFPALACLFGEIVQTIFRRGIVKRGTPYDLIRLQESQSTLKALSDATIELSRILSNVDGMTLKTNTTKTVDIRKMSEMLGAIRKIYGTEALLYGPVSSAFEVVLTKAMESEGKQREIVKNKISEIKEHQESESEAIQFLVELETTIDTDFIGLVDFVNDSSSDKNVGPTEIVEQLESKARLFRQKYKPLLDLSVSPKGVSYETYDKFIDTISPIKANYYIELVDSGEKCTPQEANQLVSIKRIVSSELSNLIVRHIGGEDLGKIDFKDKFKQAIIDGKIELENTEKKDEEKRLKEMKNEFPIEILKFSKRIENYCANLNLGSLGLLKKVADEAQQLKVRFAALDIDKVDPTAPKDTDTQVGYLNALIDHENRFKHALTRLLKTGANTKVVNAAPFIFQRQAADIATYGEAYSQNKQNIASRQYVDIEKELKDDVSSYGYKQFENKFRVRYDENVRNNLNPTVLLNIQNAFTAVIANSLDAESVRIMNNSSVQPTTLAQEPKQQQLNLIQLLKQVFTDTQSNPDIQAVSQNFSNGIRKDIILTKFLDSLLNAQTGLPALLDAVINGTSENLRFVPDLDNIPYPETLDYSDRLGSIVRKSIAHLNREKSKIATNPGEFEDVFQSLTELITLLSQLFENAAKQDNIKESKTSIDQSSLEIPQLGIRDRASLAEETI